MQTILLCKGTICGIYSLWKALTAMDVLFFFFSEFQEFLLRWKNGIWVKLFFEGRIHFDSVSGWNLFNWIELETLSSFENLNFYPSCLCNNNVCLELLLCTLSVCSASNTAFKTFLFFLFNTEKNFELTLHFAQ